MNGRKSLTLVLVSIAAALAACENADVVGPGYVCDVTSPVRDVFTSPSSAVVFVHSPAQTSDTVRIQATTTSRSGAVRTDVPVQFKSSDTTVASVSDDGTVRARKPGTAKITASACGESSSVQVTVVASVNRVTVTPLSDTVIAGDTSFVVARAFAPDGSQVQGAVFTFASSNPAVVAIKTSDSTAKFASSTTANGTTTISATAEGTVGTATLLVLPRVFLAGTAIASTIDAGDALSCGLITLGHGYCWGLNNLGQLGAKGDSTCFAGTDAGTIVNDSVKTTAKPCSLVPLRISPDVDLATISAGDSTGCALSVAGRAYCWGLNFHGEIGNGTTANKPAPTLVTSALNFSTITVGGGHTCALTASGAAYCWGNDTFGQLGDARTINSTTPIPVSGGGSTAVFATISAGFRHTCAVAVDGTGFCWGSNDLGQLGDGTNFTRDTPVQVGGGLRFSSISAGGDHSCGITTSGAAVCWGSNVDGQLGNGGVGGSSSLPVAVAGGLTFNRISASTGTRAATPLGIRYKDGSGHTCGLTTSSQVFCWGDNVDLQLGRGPFSGSSSANGSPARVFNGELPGSVNFTSVSTGSRHSCAVGTDGNAYCWGSNVFGALGNTLQAAFRGLPQKVATPQ